MAVQRLLHFLDQNHTWYSTIKHKPADRAFTSAKKANIPEEEMVKSLLLKLDGNYALAVLPSAEKINFKKLKEVTGSNRASIAEIDEVEDMFPDCMTGAIPPLGNLYHIPVISDKLITNHKDIFFEAGSHREIMKMHISDYIKLTHPKIAEIHK